MKSDRTFDNVPVTLDLFQDPPVPLVCPCGKPLSVATMKNGTVSIGDFETACSPMVNGPDYNGVIRLLLQTIKDGKFVAPIPAKGG